jgi:hypothetical protein
LVVHWLLELHEAGVGLLNLRVLNQVLNLLLIIGSLLVQLLLNVQLLLSHLIEPKVVRGLRCLLQRVLKSLSLGVAVRILLNLLVLGLKKLLDLLVLVSLNSNHRLSGLVEGLNRVTLVNASDEASDLLLLLHVLLLLLALVVVDSSDQEVLLVILALELLLWVHDLLLKVISKACVRLLHHWVVHLLSSSLVECVLELFQLHALLSLPGWSHACVVLEQKVLLLLNLRQSLIILRN